jgi:hypothetical protein
MALLAQILLNVHRDPQQPHVVAWQEVMEWLGHRLPPPVPPPPPDPEALRAQLAGLSQLFSPGSNGRVDG